MREQKTRETSEERNSEVDDRMITRYHLRGIIHLVSFPNYHPSVCGWKRHVLFSSRPEEEREREETSDARVRSPIDAGQSQGGGGWVGARARRSNKWKNKEGGGGERGLAVRPPFKMYVAYGWPKLLSISAGSSKDNFVHLFVLQDWLLLVPSSRVQMWNASQVSEWVRSWLHVVCARSIIRSHWRLLWGTCFGAIRFGVRGSGFRVFSLAFFFWLAHWNAS